MWVAAVDLLDPRPALRCDDYRLRIYYAENLVFFGVKNRVKAD